MEQSVEAPVRYLAFLRGVNISGKNSVQMSALKAGVEELGFSDVKTYLNSGNAAFSGADTEPSEIAERMQAMLRGRFGLEIPVFVLRRDELADLLQNAPDWWAAGDKARYDNLIFMLPPVTYDELLREFGAPKAGLETVMPYQCAVFWSFSRKDYQKTNWWSKTANTAVGRRLTIRTANTVKKLAGL